MSLYYRPLVQTDVARPVDAFCLAGGWCWFERVEVLSRRAPPRVVEAAALSEEALAALTSPRPAIAGLTFQQPQIMGILNVTPDSFSDGGQHFGADDAVRGAQAMAQAQIIDIGGESTRPGATLVPEDEETRRTAPVIEALRGTGLRQVISVDTRKARVAERALEAGADMVNDVSGFTFDPDLARLCADRDVPVCVMHAQGDPATMQAAPHYEDALLDVYDFLSVQIDRLTRVGIPKDRIIADPGIGFGKTLSHNLALLSRLSLFHSLGVPVLLGASRKKFIGTIGQTETARERMPGSVAVALAALHQGIQIVRVHDVAETAQAVALWRAVMAGETHE